MSALVPISSVQAELAAACAQPPRAAFPPVGEDEPRVSAPRFVWRPQAPPTAWEAADAYAGRTGTPPALLFDTYA